MPSYTVPRRDINFLLHEVFRVEQAYQNLSGTEDIDRETLDAIIEEGAKFAENELAPLNKVGDEQGCHFEDGVVTTPTGFKEAYQKYVEGGWPSLNTNADYGGQGLPNLLGVILSELSGSANWSWAMYPGLSHGAVHTIDEHGTEEQKQTYLTKLITGEWTGTMCLTEPHCGSDLGIMKTKAEPNPDGSYALSGTKIYISAGEHDLAENIVHIVLAKLPDAPEGTKGISLFIVPKFLPNEAGGIGDRNQVVCGSIEHKMGIKGSATCVLNFDQAKGFLIGPPNKGLNCMFTFMNLARVGTAIQGVCVSETAFQGALEYARDRLAMRSLSGPKHPEKEADPIIVHPDVRRMLLTQKAFAEGGRALCYFLSLQSDYMQRSASEEARQDADDLMALLTPIAKAFLTEMGCESASHGIQVYGGHGYITDWGMEQIARDARISTLYEGTTGIQALDLLGRKVLMTQGALLRKFTKLIHQFSKAHADNEPMQEFVEKLVSLNKEWGEATTKIGMAAMQNRDEVGGAASDYMMYSGYITVAYMWAMMAAVAHEKLSAGEGDRAFYKSKIETAQFYFRRILPRTQTHLAVMLDSVTTLQGLDEDEFAFL